MSTFGGPRIATALDQLAAVPRSRATSVALAGLLLLVPINSWSTRHAFGTLSVRSVELLTFLGVGAGWLVLDLLRARRPAAGWAGLAGLAIVVSGWLAWSALEGVARSAATLLAVGFVFGAAVRGRGAGRSIASLVVISAVTTWLTYDLWKLPRLPLRDLHLYLGAGTTALAGGSPYLTAPITTTANKDLLPFVYPPFTIPLFEVLASIPRPIAEAAWVGASMVAVVAGLWLLGVRGRWLFVLLAWPSLAQGIAVGNVASFAFFLFVLGFRVGAAIVLSGSFKVQSMIPSLWLIRERRWRQIVEGGVVIGVLAALSVPIVGIGTWLAWPDGLRYFQESVTRFPNLQSQSLVRLLGPILALGLTIGAIAIAFVARGRNGLARFGVASIVASPTLYLHGFAPLLAGAFVLGPELLWFALGLGPWSHFSWISVAIVGLALLRADDNALRVPGDLSEPRADLHPVGRLGQVWPET